MVSKPWEIVYNRDKFGNVKYLMGKISPGVKCTAKEIRDLIWSITGSILILDAKCKVLEIL